MGLDLFWEGLLADDEVSWRLLSGDEELNQQSTAQPCPCLMFSIVLDISIFHCQGAEEQLKLFKLWYV